MHLTSEEVTAIFNLLPRSSRFDRMRTVSVRTGLVSTNGSNLRAWHNFKVLSLFNWNHQARVMTGQIKLIHISYCIFFFFFLDENMSASLDSECWIHFSSVCARHHMFLKSRFVKVHSSLLKFGMSCKTAKCAKTSKTQILVHLEIHCYQQTLIKQVCIIAYNCKYCIVLLYLIFKPNKQTHIPHINAWY